MRPLRCDISYGVYLYGWPVQKLLIWYFPGLTSVAIFILSATLCAAAGYCSWRIVEEPFLRIKPRRKPRGLSPVPA